MQTYKNIAPGGSAAASHQGHGLNALPLLLAAATMLAGHDVGAADLNLFGSGGRPQTSVLLRDQAPADLTVCKDVKTLDLSLRWSKADNISALANLPNLTALNLDLAGSQVRDISVLKNLKKLTTLRLVASEARVDLGVLKELPELTMLDLDLQSSQLKDIGALKGLARLSNLKLNLKGSEVTDISVLKEMPALTALDLTVVKFDMQTDKSRFVPANTIRVTYANRTNIGVLGELKNLRSLNLHLIGAMSGPIDISPLKELKGLTTLKLEMEDAVADIGPLKDLAGLTSFSFNPHVNWNSPTAKGELTYVIETLNALVNLKDLHLDLRAVAFPGGYAEEFKKLKNLTSATVNIYTEKDAAVLAEFKNLDTLTLAMNASGVTSLAVLKDLPNLTTLNLDMTHEDGMKSVDWLQELPHLTALNLNIGPNSRVVDMGVLAKLKNLARLTLNVNFNTPDINPLQGMKNLAYLSLDLKENYKILDLNALKGLTRLSTLSLRLPYTEGKTFDINALGELSNLATLNLDFSRAQGKITDISVTRNLSKLQSLAMHGNLATDGSYLAGLKGLTRLDVKETGLRLKSLPQNVSDFALGSYATEINWELLELWE
jgi:hypothetical protein